ncbi:hypothetical protein TRICI_000458 [Trichomonascus ciferrii]|uniref:Peptidyl-tRNA hydrolase n=1 Tax=Trichomonascus ciferrii TaxID=44093 RepID=A0A642VDE2_9ASCO|nr:hypothetical protein TRICI_000458 [Trichomonascus ciferrii]
MAKGGVDWVRSLVGRQNEGPISLIVASLGNPGPQYKLTRHNAGHIVLNSVRQKLQLGQALTKPIQGGTLTRFDNCPGLIFTESCHYMNLSGRAIRGVYKWYDKHYSNMSRNRKLLVLHDELDLPLGTVAYKQPSRATNGHNGLKHIVHQTDEPFARMRIGIGRPDTRHKADVAKYVLAPFTPTELQAIQEDAANQVVDYLYKVIDHYELK